jgi:DNA-binding MarR family transcriptional regulator
MADDPPLSPSDPVDAATLAGHLGFLIRIAQQRIFEEFHGRFGAEGLTPARFSVLTLLAAHPGARQVAIARALHVKQSNFAVLVAAMEAEGLVARHAEPGNRRANLLHLTPAGAALHGRLTAEVEAMEADITRHLSAAERRTLLGALRRFLYP